MKTKGESLGGTATVKKLPHGNFEIEVQQCRFETQPHETEDLLYALSSALRPYAGYSIFDRVQQELDAVIDRLQAGEGDERDPGRAEGYTTCLALIRDPYQPDYPGEKKRQMERWKKRNI